MNLNSNWVDYERELKKIELESLSLGITDPLDPRMSKIFYLYGLIAFKKIENTLPFQDITEEFKEIDNFLVVAAEICEDDELFVKIYSLIGDLYALVDFDTIAELSYREAMKQSRSDREILQLYVAIIQLRIVFLKQDDTQNLFNEAKKMAFDTNSELFDTIMKLEEEWIISISDSSYDESKSTNQSERKLRTSDKYQQMKNLGVFGSYKKSVSKNEIMN